MTQMSQNRGEMKFGEMIRLKMRATPPRSRMTSRPAQQMHTVDMHTAGSATFLNSVTWKIDADEATIKPPADKPTKNMNAAMYRPQEVPLFMPVTPKPNMVW